MREIVCICGERVVFLDPDVKVKTCPNCGISVYQEGVPTIALEGRARRRGLTLTRQSKITVLLTVGAAVLLAGTLGMIAGRRYEMGRAAALAGEAEAAAGRGEYNTAIETYSQALGIYWMWFGGREAMAPVEAALANVRGKKAAEEALRSESAAGPVLLTVPLEELAQQAYSNTEEGWQKAFEKDFAGRTFAVRGKVEERTGEAYKASSLTLSYRIFDRSGDEVRMTFDPPLFERYRMKAGTDCIVSAHASRMYLDKGAPGEKGQWVLVIDGARSNLVTDAGSLRALGWKIDDEVENLVASQRELSPAY